MHEFQLEKNEKILRKFLKPKVDKFTLLLVGLLPGIGGAIYK
jgi:hypothetical protein